MSIGDYMESQPEASQPLESESVENLDSIECFTSESGDAPFSVAEEDQLIMDPRALLSRFAGSSPGGGRIFRPSPAGFTGSAPFSYEVPFQGRIPPGPKASDLSRIEQDTRSYRPVHYPESEKGALFQKMVEYTTPRTGDGKSLSGRAINRRGAQEIYDMVKHLNPEGLKDFGLLMEEIFRVIPHLYERVQKKQANLKTRARLLYSLLKDYMDQRGIKSWFIYLLRQGGRHLSVVLIPDRRRAYLDPSVPARYFLARGGEGKETVSFSHAVVVECGMPSAACPEHGLTFSATGFADWFQGPYNQTRRSLSTSELTLEEGTYEQRKKILWEYGF